MNSLSTKGRYDMFTGLITDVGRITAVKTQEKLKKQAINMVKYKVL